MDDNHIHHMASAAYERAHQIETGRRQTNMSLAVEVVKAGMVNNPKSFIDADSSIERVYLLLDRLTKVA